MIFAADLLIVTMPRILCLQTNENAPGFQDSEESPGFVIKS